MANSRSLPQLSDHCITERRQRVRVRQSRRTKRRRVRRRFLQRSEVVDELRPRCPRSESARNVDAPSLRPRHVRSRGGDECDLHLQRTPPLSRQWPHVVELVDDVGVHVPPVGVLGDQAHRSLACPADDDRNARHGPGYLLRAVQRPQRSPSGSSSSPVQRPLMISSDSRRRPSRTFGSCDPTPTRPSSPATEPHPIPSSNRPPEAWSMETASRARTAGCRNESQRTSDPTRRRSVLLASHVLVTIASNMGWFSARGRSEVIHAGDAGEPRLLCGTSVVNHLVHGQPHLRQKDPELEWALHGRLLVGTTCRIVSTTTLTPRPPMTGDAEDIYRSSPGNNRSGAAGREWGSRTRRRVDVVLPVVGKVTDKGGP